MTEPKVYFDFAMATITRKVYVSHAKKATYSVLKVVEIVINTQVVCAQIIILIIKTFPTLLHELWVFSLPPPSESLSVRFPISPHLLVLPLRASVFCE